MSAASRAKRRSRVGGPVPDGAGLQSRKEENIQLHDEADLVNFRTDAYTRFVNNQDYLENVALKLFHTSQISPPPSFPVAKSKKYSENALDSEVEKVLQELKPEELWMGDLRLMKAKLVLSLQQVKQEEKELNELSPQTIFSDLFLFQSEAIKRLAKLQRSCHDLESSEALEKAMEETLEQYKEKFGQTLEVQQQPYERKSIPVATLAPGVEVKQAPPLYNPRLIMSFIDINGESNNGGMSGQEYNTDENMLLDTEKLAGQLPFMNNGMQGDDEFGMMMDLEPKSTGPQDSNQPSGAPSADYSGATPYNGQNYNAERINYGQGEYGANDEKPTPAPASNAHPSSGASNQIGESAGAQEEADMNMDDLNQFLAEPNENEGMDDMDALMNFDGDNDNGEGLMGDDEFNVNFLSQMDNEM